MMVEGYDDMRGKEQPVQPTETYEHPANSHEQYYTSGPAIRKQSVDREKNEESYKSNYYNTKDK